VCTLQETPQPAAPSRPPEPTVALEGAEERANMEKAEFDIETASREMFGKVSRQLQPFPSRFLL